LPMAKNFLYFS